MVAIIEQSAMESNPLVLFRAAGARILFDADHRLDAFEQLRMGGAERRPAMVQGLHC
jgi:hypothetical protein